MRKNKWQFNTKSPGISPGDFVLLTFGLVRARAEMIITDDFN
jgi:hypothetical protein